MTAVAIMGAAGRMGQALIRCMARDAGLTLAAAVERADCPALGRDAGLAGGNDTGISITADLDAIAAADVLIDFTNHAAVPRHADAAARLGKAMVLGTTGLTPDETAAVNNAAQRIPIVWAPNTSLGVNLLVELIRQAAGALGDDYDAEIVETHHRHKQDAPSGTALHLGQAVARGRGVKLDAVRCGGREGITGERPRGQIGIHAVRAGGVVGDHVVSFASEDEIVELTHHAISRDAFAVGALRAAAWVVGRAPGLYGMKDVLGL